MPIWKLLTGPLANPFRVFHQPRGSEGQTKFGVNGGYHLTWERKTLPDAGAGQYAWETYGLPPTAAYGFGNIHVTNPLRETSPAGYVFQSVGIVGNPPTSFPQGQFITQPLMDINSAENSGVVTPGAVPNAPNMITRGGPVLSP